MARLKSAIFVSALIRRAAVEGAMAMLLRKGAEEAGAVFVKVARLDGTAALYGPAPMSALDTDDAAAGGRLFCVLVPPGSPEAEVERRIASEVRFDPDLFVVEIEDKAGRHFLDLAPD